MDEKSIGIEFVSRNVVLFVFCAVRITVAIIPDFSGGNSFLRWPPPRRYHLPAPSVPPLPRPTPLPNLAAEPCGRALPEGLTDGFEQLRGKAWRGVELGAVIPRFVSAVDKRVRRVG